MYAGIAAILDRIPSCESLDLVAAMELTAKPRVGAATYPFKKERGDNKSAKADDKHKLGTGAGDNIKYDRNNMPSKIRILLEEKKHI